MAVTTCGSTLLVVESEGSVRQARATSLSREGFIVKVAGYGDLAIALYEAVHPDLVLIDVVLPDVSGLDLCHRFRSRSDVPIIMVSARSSEIDAVVALEMGADDFVSQTCRIQELVARIRAALRRAPTADAPVGRPVLHAGDVVLDRERFEVTVAGRRLDLPRKEFQLLQVLLEHPGRVLARQTIMRRVWGEDYVGDTKTLDVHIRRLRGKLEEEPGTPRRLLTVRGIGFKFEPVTEKRSADRAPAQLVRAAPSA